MSVGVANAGISGNSSCGPYTVFTTGYNSASGNYLFTSKIGSAEKSEFEGYGKTFVQGSSLHAASWAIGTTSPNAYLNGGCSN